MTKARRPEVSKARRAESTKVSHPEGNEHPARPAASGPGVSAHGFRKDVYPLHFPPTSTRTEYDKDVGLAGYDRDAGKSVPGEPVLRLPGDQEPRARPFATSKKDIH